MILPVFLGLMFSGIVGAALGSKKDRIADGFLYGIFLGPLGWALIAFGPVITLIIFAIFAGVMYGEVRHAEEKEQLRKQAEAAKEAADEERENERIVRDVQRYSTPAPSPGDWMWRQGGKTGQIGQ